MVEFRFDPNDPDAEYTEYHVFEDHFDLEWDRQFDTTSFRVETSNHGWQNNSGTFEKNYPNGHDAISDIVEGIPDWSMDAIIDEEGCFITLYSHDNPTGASFELYPQ